MRRPAAKKTKTAITPSSGENRVLEGIRAGFAFIIFLFMTYSSNYDTGMKVRGTRMPPRVTMGQQ